MSGIIVASSNADVGIAVGIDVLRSGGSAADAVIAAIKPVEANPDDHSVGYSGLPNLLGEVELDASFMIGAGLRAGAVGALQGYGDAIELARHVMDGLPHAMIAGEGAARLAHEVGLTPLDLLTPEAERIWRERLDEHHVHRDGAYIDRVREMVGAVTSDPQFPEPPHGTVNVIARDRDGRIACGVSTSGWAWKYPGRLGDSPVIGAGNYADDRWGAAACTGRGEMAIRCCTAHSVVTFLRFGMSLEEALRQAMLDLQVLDDPYASEMNIVAIAQDGAHGAASTAAGKTYIVMDETMTAHEELPRTHIPISF